MVPVRRAGVIAPIVPPLSLATAATVGPSVATLVRGPLPLPTLTPRRTATTVYGLSAMDDRGRIADRATMRTLGWPAGLGLDIDESGGVLTLRPDPSGAFQVTNQGFVRLSAALRHRCALEVGDRVLLAADPERSRLTIYPPAALDLLLSTPNDSIDGAT